MNHVVLRPLPPSGNPRAPPPDQGTATDLRIGFHLYATARRLPFSGELAPRFQVNDAGMRRSDWWKRGQANRRLNPDKDIVVLLDVELKLARRAN